MAKSKSTKPTNGPAPVVQQPTPPTHHGSSAESDPDDVGDDPMEKDETEEALERLVFGDEVGFKEGLKTHTWEKGPHRPTEESPSDEEDVAEGKNEGELEGVDDDALFYLDSGPTPLPHDALVPTPAADDQDDDDTFHTRHPPAWEDSDDDRIMVSLATDTRLRKLRISEAEDVIGGKEYIKRLRRQYERLHPVPEWALSASTAVHKRKRRKMSETAGSAVEWRSSADEMDVDGASSDDEGLFAQPLAKLLQSTQQLTRMSDTVGGKRRKLRPEVIDIQRMKDIPGSQPAAVTTLSFHPHYPILLSAGPSGTITLHHLLPTSTPPYPTITSLHISSHPLTTTAFHLPPDSSDTSIVFSSRRRYFHTWHLPTGQIAKTSRIYGHADDQRSFETFKLSPDGRYMALKGTGRKGGGVINLLDARTTQWIAQVRVESRGGIADFAWWGDSQGLVIAGKNGEVTEWDVRSKTTVARWVDDGAVGTTVVALGSYLPPSPSTTAKPFGTDRYIALGSTSGIVNIYDRSLFSATSSPLTPKPTRTLSHLTTPTSHLVFSPCGQLLVLASRAKKDALRLVHLPSLTVYRNWPTDRTPLGRVASVAWSPEGSMLALGSEGGRVRVWEVKG
ncbi:MAG: hypothetical protein M1817_002141 [Caeruleum heppii]|nr:MAG: hypothetical protein M1817_002141 [Caeruleum heppii]